MDIRKALQELANEVKVEILLRLRSNLGINTNPRVMSNTLIGSNLESSIKVSVDDNSTLSFVIANYYMVVTAGRKANSKMPPIKAILDWIKRKDIDTSWASSQNAAAWAIAKSIAKEGYRGRPFIGFDPNDRVNEDVDVDLDLILTFLDDYFDTWRDKIFEEITKELDKFFNNG